MVTLEIIEYESKYNEIIKDLLVEIQEYIVEIDREKFNKLTNEYREKYFDETMQEVKKYKGKIFLAKEENEIVGLVIGYIHNEEVDSYDFSAPKRGFIKDLVVSKNYRSKGIGKQLLNAMETYFKDIGCKGVLLNVFAYNENAMQLYIKNGYFNRCIEMMKEI